MFFVKQLFKNYEIKHFSIQLIFSITFALSLTLFELIIFEIIGILESSSRFFHWRLSLVAILVMVVAVIPYKIAHSLISNIRISEKKIQVFMIICNDALSNCTFQFPKGTRQRSQSFYGSFTFISFGESVIHSH